MASRHFGVVLTVGGLLLFVVGLLQLMPCLYSTLTLSFPLGQCWADFLLTVVGGLLFTR